MMGYMGPHCSSEINPSKITTNPNCSTRLRIKVATLKVNFCSENIQEFKKIRALFRTIFRKYDSFPNVNWDLLSWWPG